MSRSAFALANSHEGLQKNVCVCMLKAGFDIVQCSHPPGDTAANLVHPCMDSSLS